MALKATIHKASLQIADLDRNIYGDHGVTLARHPSETDERMMIRLLAFALNVPADKDNGALDFAKDLWDTDEPALWQKDLVNQVAQWIEVGQPDEKRLLRASSRAERVAVYAFSSNALAWWSGVATKITRAENLNAWLIQAKQSHALAALAGRTMQLQITIQEGHVWIGDTARSVEVTPQALGGTDSR